MRAGAKGRRGKAPSLELINHVELIALEEVLWRLGTSPVQRPADQSGEGQGYVAEGLIEHLGAVLGNIAGLANVAEVKSAHHSFALDEKPGVSELPVTFFLSAAK